MESNINKGRLLTEVANEVQFDAMTIGNHEFDWGHYFIEENAKLKSNDDYSTPILGANIYNYDINSKKVLDYADLGLEYTISELDNGIKVGIIGYIGPGQISSITSTNVDHLSFVEPFSIIKNLSTKLRNKGCHIVALSGHEEANEIASLSSGSDKVTNYVDVIFGAHTHDWEIFTSNGVPCIQSGDNGISVGKIVLNYSKSGISVATHTNLNDNNINVDIDDEIQAIYDKYNDEIVEVSNSLVATFDSAPTRANASYIMTAGLADYSLENNLDVSYTLINNARTSIDNKNATYSDLYKAYCFDNVVYIAEVSGRDLSYELKYGYFYRLDPEPLNTSKTYKIAVIDYVLCHRNDNREYDNFTNFNIIGRYEKVGSELYTYRDVCIDWLLSLKGTTISTSYFTKNSNFHNYNSVTSKVTLSNHPYVHKDS